MSGIRITVNGEEEIERANNILRKFVGGEGVHRAIAAASKRAGEQGKTKAGTFAAQEYSITKGVFMSNVTTKLMPISEGFTLSFSGGVIPIGKFKTNDIRPRGTSTSVKRGQTSRLPHVFGLGGSFVERVGKSRYPLEAKFGPSTGHMMQNDEVIDQMSQTITEAFDKRMEVEINRLLAGL